MIQIQYKKLVPKIITPITICDSLSISCKEYNAVWDTGAVRTIISPKVIEELKLIPLGNGGTIKIGDKSEHPCENYEIRIFNPQTKKPIPLVVAGFDIPHFDIVIGMNFITNGEFIFKSVNGVSEFSFTIY